MTKRILFFLLFSIVILAPATGVAQHSVDTAVSSCCRSPLFLKGNRYTTSSLFTVNENPQFIRPQNSIFPEQLRPSTPVMMTNSSRQLEQLVSATENRFFESETGLTTISEEVDPQTGSISGRVTSCDCAGLENVRVNVIQGDYDSSIVAYTDSQGNYTVTGLSSGDYDVFFWGLPIGYQDKWYNNIQGSYGYNICDVDHVTVNAPDVTTGIDAFLEKGANIFGRVVNLAGEGVANINVYAYHDSFFRTTVRTDAEGYYALTGLSSDEYTLQYEESKYQNQSLTGYIGEWYSNKTDYHTADPIAVTAPESRTLSNTVLETEPLGGISGQVTLNGTDGVQGISVFVWDSYHTSWIKTGVTDQDGNYSVAGLPAGEYLVEFASNNSEYSLQWYQGHDTFQTSDAVSVTPSRITPHIDVKLQFPGSISGHVPHGINGLAWSRVIAFNPNGDTFGSVSIDENGNYSIEGLPSGEYLLRFDLADAGYEWYQGSNGRETADIVQVTAPNSRTNIDSIRFPVAEKGNLSGKVTDKCTGKGISRISIEVYDTAWNYFGSTETDCTGAYIKTDIPVGDYLVFFRMREVEEERFYIGQWYNNVLDHGHGNTVTITADHTTENIDAQMEYGGTITGRITDAVSGSGIPDIYPTVYGLDDDSAVISYGVTTTNSNGKYVISGVPPGEVKVKFEGIWTSRYGNQWYQSRPDHASATPVHVAPFGITSGIDDVFSLSAKPFFSPHIIMLLLGGNGQEICDAIVEDSWAIGSGIADYYAVPIHTTMPPPVTLTAGSEGTVLIIGDPNSTIKYESVEVALSPHITDVSVVTHYQYDINITVTEGAGKCQFEKRPPQDPPEEGIWSRDDNGVHYFYTL